MLPSFLASSYRQYKADFDVVATWLATTAQRDGYPSDLLIPPPLATAVKSKRLKGKARKEARVLADSAQGGSGAAPSTNIPKYKLAIKDFLPFAQWIARTAQSQQPSVDQEKESSHQFFIGVLKSVRKALKPLFADEVDKFFGDTSQVTAAPASDASSLTRAIQEFNVTASDPVEEAAEKQTIQYTVDAPADRYEAFVACTCIIDDLYQIRIFLQSVLEGYKTGAFDLVTVSITTNTAVDLARSIQEDFEATSPQQANFQQLVNLYCVCLCFANGDNPRGKEHPRDDFNFAAYDRLEEISLPTMTYLSGFADVLNATSLPIMKPGFYGTYEPTNDRSRKTGRDKCLEDKIVLFESLPEFCVVVRGGARTPAEDELVRGVRDLDKKKTPSMWLVLAAQVYLDIHHCLRSDVSKGYQELCRVAEEADESVSRILDFLQTVRVDTWPKSNDEALRQIIKYARSMKTDIIGQARKHLLRKQPHLDPHIPDFWLIKSHPWWCGLLMYDLKMQTQEAGLVFANAWGSVLYTAHLYNALKQESLMSRRWPDLDLVMTIHRSQDMFIGAFPRQKADYIKRFMLSMGYSSTAFAAKTRQQRSNEPQSRLRPSLKGPRSLDELAPVSQIFKERICNNSGRNNLTPADLDKILSKAATDNQDPGRVPRLFETGSIELRGFPDRSEQSQLAGRSALHPVELLSQLLKALQEEVVDRNVDYFALHLERWQALRAINDLLRPDLEKLIGPKYIEKQSQLPWVVGYLFTLAAGDSRSAALLANRSIIDLSASTQLLSRAGSCIDQLLASGSGRAAVERIEKLLNVEMHVPELAALTAVADQVDPDGQRTETDA